MLLGGFPAWQRMVLEVLEVLGLPTAILGEPRAEKTEIENLGLLGLQEPGTGDAATARLPQPLGSPVC